MRLRAGLDTATAPVVAGLVVAVTVPNETVCERDDLMGLVEVTAGADGVDVKLERLRTRCRKCDRRRSYGGKQTGQDNPPHACSSLLVPAVAGANLSERL